MNIKHKGIILPGSDQRLLQSLVDDYHFNVNTLADKLGVSSRTIYRILRQGNDHEFKARDTLIGLYISCQRIKRAMLAS